MYSPRINPDQVIQLYKIKQTNKKPMTRMVNEAITDYLNKLEEKKHEKEEARHEGIST
jgi:hypothetical protein